LLALRNNGVQRGDELYSDQEGEELNGVQRGDEIDSDQEGEELYSDQEP
jgi:hypothetical protein